jgi:hypothetical protein
MLDTVTKLPAAPPRFNLSFDKSAYIAPQYPVSVRKTKGGFRSTGIGWEDLQHMSVRNSRCDNRPKQAAMPEWARHDKLIGELAVSFLENRIRLQPIAGATLKERRDRAMKELAALRPHYNVTLTNCCQRYVELKNTNPRDKRLRKLEIQIENLDTQLLILDKSIGIIVSIIYMYWRANMDSVGVALALGIKPPHVRTILCRLQSLWEKLQDPNYVPRYVMSYRQRAENDARRKLRQEELALQRQARQQAYIVAPGKVYGRLTVLGLHVDVVPVDVISTVEPRSLVAYGPYGRKRELWIENKYLEPTGFRKAIMRCDPAFESWDCKCECGKQITVNTTKLRQSEVTSCNFCK